MGAEHQKRIGLKAPILTESRAALLEIGEEIKFVEKKVRFSFRNCDMNDYCIRDLSDEKLERFYKRMEYFEGMSWGQVREIPRENGFSIESKSSQNFSLMKGYVPTANTFFHFRVNGTGSPMRVFCYQLDDMACITLIDGEGIINH